MKLVVLLILYVFINAHGRPELSQHEYALPVGATADDCEEYAVPKALNDLFAKNKVIAFSHQCVTFDLEPLRHA